MNPILTTPYNHNLGGNTAAYESAPTETSLKMMGGRKKKRQQSKKTKKQQSRKTKRQQSRKIR